MDRYSRFGINKVKSFGIIIKIKLLLLRILSRIIYLQLFNLGEYGSGGAPRGGRAAPPARMRVAVRVCGVLFFFKCLFLGFTREIATRFRELFFPGGNVIYLFDKPT